MCDLKNMIKFEKHY